MREKKSRRTQTETQLQNIQPGLLKTAKVINNKGSLRKCPSLEEPEEKGQLSVTWEAGTGTEKDISGKRVKCSVRFRYDQRVDVGSLL